MKLRVPLYGAVGKVVWVDDEATKGAVVGTNLYLSDGKTLVTEAMLTGGSSTSSTPDLGTTDQLNEGQYHLYFTDLRAQDAVGGILADSANVSLSYSSGTSLTADLIDLADTGSGTALVKLTRDAKGRISGTSAATTSDLAEGSNLYYTDARASAAAPVQSVNGLAGTVSLTAADVGAATTAQGAKADSAIQSIVAGTGISVDATDPQNPVVSTTGAGSGDVVGPASATDGYVALFDGTTGKLLKDGGSFGDLVRAAVLTGLSLATSAVISATDTVLGALGKLQAQITDNLLPKGYIDGLQMVWVSGTALTVTSGAAYIEGSSKVLRSTSAIAKTGLSLTASTWYHVYLYDNAGTPAVEIVTTAPASPYNGTARSKTGDTSRRYMGSVKSDVSSNLIPFEHELPGTIAYLENINGHDVISGGKATTATIVSCSAWVPITGRSAYIQFFDSDGSAAVFITNPNGPSPNPAYFAVCGPGEHLPLVTRLDALQRFTYRFDSSPAGACFARVAGFTFER